MKLKRTFLAMLILLPWIMTNAQIAGTTNVETNKESSSIEWVSVVRDFGEINLNEPATAIFEFKNTGTEPLTILAVKSSCGCTVADYTKEPILPNKSSSVSATYNAKKIGTFQKAITVTMNDNQQYRLTLKGIVVEKKDQ